ncbi:MAG TPA: OB-fold nucleic acid binding domain-containing protein, partial [Acidimicrobiales bacterium]|nr:OB-fold nucleic acid binding domain-containing protein [Acidimicrobiales bacterium]
GHAKSIPVGHAGSGLLYGASLFFVLKAFASGGSALTGTEAISNGVSIFRQPESRNARITMVWMATILGSLVLGVSSLAAITHPVPYISGTPTVISQVAQYVYGGRNILYVLLQIGTTLILILAANTSFTGFPFLASFAAEDSYLPRQLTKRGHRLVFSTGIVALTVVSVALLIITNAQVDKLIPLYAIGVFTGFTMAGAGMAKYHWTHREPQWRRRLAINGTASVLSFIVLMIITVTKFTEGAWTIVILLPLGVFVLLRLHRQYAQEDAQLEVGAQEACEAPVLRRHTVIVLVDRIDLATARAIQYGRTLAPDQLRAVHFAIDPDVAVTVEREWRRLGLSRLPLDVIEAPDRRLGRAALELAAEAAAGGDTEVTLLLPRRDYNGAWARLLHDRTADAIVEIVSQLPHVNATIVPFQLAHRRLRVRLPRSNEDRDARPDQVSRAELGPRAEGTVPIGDVQWRTRVRVAGRVKSIRVPTRAGTAILECTLADRTGAILLVFQGRRSIPGITQGSRLVAEGMVGAWDRRLAILNPDYELIAGGDPREARLPG